MSYIIVAYNGIYALVNEQSYGKWHNIVIFLMMIYHDLPIINGDCP